MLLGDLAYLWVVRVSGMVRVIDLFGVVVVQDALVFIAELVVVLFGLCDAFSQS